jgi:hypothetical protein
MMLFISIFFFVYFVYYNYLFIYISVCYSTDEMERHA